MKTSPLKPIVLGALVAAGPSFQAQAQIQVRMSIKVILDANGHRPAGGNLSTDDGIRDNVATNSNTFLAAYGRGYQLKIVEILDLPGHSELSEVEDCALINAIRAGLRTDPTGYLWSTDAMNVYINKGTNGPGAHPGCSGGLGDMVTLKYTSGFGLHETGHYLGLCHTQGCDCPGCDVCTNLIDDGIADTLPDRECWSKDQISMYSYSLSYANLNPQQQARVNDTFNNVMSYHGPDGGSHDVLTPGQLDKMADGANSLVASNVVSGFTWFVDRDNTCAAPVGNSTCIGGFAGPLLTVARGIAAASGTDIVLIRPGHYNEPMTITKAVTLRATRGDALVGKP